MVKRLFLKLLVFYKRFVSGGEVCRFVPSCSEYMYQAVEKYGVIKGLRLGLIRLSKCHPGNPGGIDLLQ